MFSQRNAILALMLITVVACAPQYADTTTTEADHGHDAAPTREWDGEVAPDLDFNLTHQGGDQWFLDISLEGFEVSEPTEVVHRPGTGHVHVFLDGQVLAMVFEPTMTLTVASPGTHQVRVLLGTNDHMDYVIDGQPVALTKSFIVEGDVVSAAEIVVQVIAGTVDVVGPTTVAVGDEVAITVSSDTADEVHIHGYDAVVPVAPGNPAIIRLKADVPGVFEVELEGSGLSLFRLTVG